MAVAGLGSSHALIGAPLNISGGTNGGAAYLYNTNGTLEMTFTNPAALSGDQFGVSLAAVGDDRVLIGANQGGASRPTGGFAYLFATNGTLLMTYTNPTPLAFDGFGFSVAAAGDSRVLIGALGDDVGANSAGVAYLYATANGGYTPGLNGFPSGTTVACGDACARRSNQVPGRPDQQRIEHPRHPVPMTALIHPT